MAKERGVEGLEVSEREGQHELRNLIPLLAAFAFINGAKEPVDDRGNVRALVERARSVAEQRRWPFSRLQSGKPNTS